MSKANPRWSRLHSVEIGLLAAVIAGLYFMFHLHKAPEREKARNDVCVSHLRQIGQALSLYQADWGEQPLIPGTPMQAWQLGLPELREAPKFFEKYIKDRSALICPDHHGTPKEIWTTTYRWCPLPDEDRPERLKFSHVIAEMGEQTPIVTCHEHNPPPDQLRQLKNQTVIVLRLNHSVQAVEKPLTSYWPDF